MSESSRSDIPSCIHWDGEHLPTELRALPPGRYELVPCEELTADQEAGIAQGFQSVAEGRGAPWSEVRERLRAIVDLRRTTP